MRSEEREGEDSGGVDYSDCRLEEEARGRKRKNTL